jgi:glutathione peroxidase
VPSNDFNQEPGGASEILATAKGHYGVSFPLTDKAALRGPDAHPFYRWAAAERPLDVPIWNFHKYLVGRDGRLAAVFPTRAEPMDARVIEAIARELKVD